jgi:WD40 repeat protein
MEIQALAWGPQDHLLAVGAKDGTVRLWQPDGRPAHRFAVSTVGIESLEFTPDGRRLVAGIGNGGMRVWDVADGVPVQTGPYIPWGFARENGLFVGGSRNSVAFCKWVVPTVLST